jgi:glutamate/tyrosine decarboxylase-like PLP-dependent enzyme
MENTLIFYRLSEESTDFEAAHEPQCNILCFRFNPNKKENKAENLSEIQQKIRQQQF